MKKLSLFIFCLLLNCFYQQYSISLTIPPSVTINTEFTFAGKASTGIITIKVKFDIYEVQTVSVKDTQGEFSFPLKLNSPGIRKVTVEGFTPDSKVAATATATLTAVDPSCKPVIEASIESTYKVGQTVNFKGKATCGIFKVYVNLDGKPEYFKNAAVSGGVFSWSYTFATGNRVRKITLDGYETSGAIIAKLSKDITIEDGSSGGSRFKIGLGLDYSTLVSTSTAKCFKDAGYQYVIPRGYCSTGAVDKNIKQNIVNAKSVGFSMIDVYIFPCVSCGNPAGQINDLIDSLKGYSFSYAWVDVENYKWTSNTETNRNFIRGMISQLKARNIPIGVYTNIGNWQAIVGLSWTELSSYPLWYARYDNSKSFDDFKPFGGWNKPAIKQYKGDTTICGQGVDINYS